MHKGRTFGSSLGRGFSPGMPLLLAPRLAPALALALTILAGPVTAGGALLDPTAPARPILREPAAGSAVPAVVERPVLRLQGVWQRGTDRVAIVNGTRVRAGDRVEGSRVVAVLHDGVQVRSSDGRSETLRLLPRIRTAASELLPVAEGDLAVRR